MCGTDRTGGVWANSIYEQVSAVSALEPSAVGVSSLGGTSVVFESVCFKTTLPKARNEQSVEISSPASAASIFKIDAETGQITVTEDTLAAVLDYESVSSFSLEVTVSDDGIVPMKSITCGYSDFK